MPLKITDEKEEKSNKRLFSELEEGDVFCVYMMRNTSGRQLYRKMANGKAYNFSLNSVVDFSSSLYDQEEWLLDAELIVSEHK